VALDCRRALGIEDTPRRRQTTSQAFAPHAVPDNIRALDDCRQAQQEDRPKNLSQQRILPTSGTEPGIGGTSSSHLRIKPTSAERPWARSLPITCGKRRAPGQGAGIKLLQRHLFC
jgi:hypothetical protein